MTSCTTLHACAGVVIWVATFPDLPVLFPMRLLLDNHAVGRQLLKQPVSHACDGMRRVIKHALPGANACATNALFPSTTTRILNFHCCSYFKRPFQPSEKLCLQRIMQVRTPTEKNVLRAQQGIVSQWRTF